MLKQWVSAAFLVLFFATPGWGYIVAVPQGQGPIDADRPTHVLLSGRGTNLGTQPQMSARGKAAIYRRNFPDHQVVMISVLESEKNEADLLSNGWTLLVSNDAKLDTASAVTEMLKLRKIKSLEFFGHNSPSLGTQADGKGFRFDFTQPIVAQLTSRFDADAYAIIHGCNSGWILAQEMSRVWKIAVAGSFTGTRFERLHSDGHFYVDDRNKFPPGGWASRNDDLGVSCDEGGCLRMRPSFSPYNGEWGDFEAPMLAHYKFFCQLDTNECEKRMALSLYGFLAEKTLDRRSSSNDFRDVAKQFLCPVYKDRVLTKECYEQLDRVEDRTGSLRVSFVVSGKQLACDLRSCKAKMTCDNALHRCEIKAEAGASRSKTLAEEYLHFLKGFETLQAGGGL